MLPAGVEWGHALHVTQLHNLCFALVFWFGDMTILTLRQYWKLLINFIYMYIFNWVPCRTLPAEFVSKHSFVFTGAFLLLRQGCSLFGVQHPLILLMLTDFLVPPEQGQVNDSNDKAASNPCPNCNLGYSFQILQNNCSDPFSSLC